MVTRRAVRFGHAFPAQFTTHSSRAIRKARLIYRTLTITPRSFPAPWNLRSFHTHDALPTPSPRALPTAWMHGNGLPARYGRMRVIAAGSKRADLGLLRILLVGPFRKLASAVFLFIFNPQGLGKGVTFGTRFACATWGLSPTRAAEGRTNPTLPIFGRRRRGLRAELVVDIYVQVQIRFPASTAPTRWAMVRLFRYHRTRNQVRRSGMFLSLCRLPLT